MTKPRSVIDYAPPRRSAGRDITDRLANTLRYLGWFIWRRPLRAHEAFIGCWLALALLWAVMALKTLREGYVFMPSHLMTSLAMSLLLVAATGFTVSALRGRWWPLIICVTVALPAGAASGLFQYDHCPHATYLQVVGVSIPVVGKACRNPRDAAPWWMRR